MRSLSLLFAILLLARHASSSISGGAGGILVVGSANADTFLPVKRLPVEGENLTVPPGRTVEIDVPGGKGCNQAVAAAKLLRHVDIEGAQGSVAFLGQFGNDAAATILRSALTDANVDVSACGTCRDAPSGRGYVFLQEHSGKVSAVVLGGSNIEGWKGWEHDQESSESSAITDQYLDTLLDGKSCILLQREVPEYVNYRIAKRAKEVGVMVMQDVGGEDRPMDEAMMSLCDYIIPNASELNRLCKSLGEGGDTEGDEDQEENINKVIERAKLLQEHGANNVLVTLGERGSVLVTKDADSPEAIIQESCRLPSHLSVVDETGAGDCFRAAFAVACAVERRSIREAMQVASAAGCLAVTRKGAVPSIPDRADVDALCRSSFGSPTLSVPRGGDDRSSGQDYSDDECPHMFGSRLNSMKDRPELYDDGELSDVRHWVQRQGKIRGLGCVDFNYPQHFHSWINTEAKAALDEVGLVAGAVCLRYPSKFARGAMNHPDANLRREAIDLTKEAAQTARDLGCNEVVVWSAYDGYDYPFQVNYHDKWKQLVDAFRECCDAYPDIKFSLEFKPSDENTRGSLQMNLHLVLCMLSFSGASFLNFSRIFVFCVS